MSSFFNFTASLLFAASLLGLGGCSFVGDSGGGGGDDCEGALVDCDGRCTSLSTDPLNCGRCGEVCPQGMRCEIGECVGGIDNPNPTDMPRPTDDPGCPAGQSDCGGACIDTTSDPSNCGRCGSSCDRGEACLGGRCQSAPTECPPEGCPAGFFCDLNTNTCQVGCLADSACPAGSICENRDCRAGCRRDEQCATGQICDDDTASCQSGCRDDETCGIGRICEDSQCRAGCRSDGGCPEGQICREGICIGGCRNDSTCPLGRICQDSSCTPGCRDDDNCPPEALCLMGNCVTGGCRSRDECPVSQVCAGGSCVAGPDRCSDDDDCGNGYDCSSGGFRCISVECEAPRDCALSNRCEAGSCEVTDIGDLCESDEDCGFGARCWGGSCRLWDCERDSNCPDGFGCDRIDGLRVCVNHRDAPCAGHAICGRGDRCNPVGHLCEAYNNSGFACACGDRKTCVNDRCMNGTRSGICIGTYGSECTGSTFCAQDGYCHDWSCNTNEDCPFGTACERGSHRTDDASISGRTCLNRWERGCDAGTNCGNGLRCTDRECVAEDTCTGAQDCPSRWGCDVPRFGGDRRCAPWYEIECESDDECPAGATCDPTPEGGRCGPGGAP